MNFPHASSLMPESIEGIHIRRRPRPTDTANRADDDPRTTLQLPTGICPLILTKPGCFPRIPIDAMATTPVTIPGVASDDRSTLDPEISFCISSSKNHLGFCHHSFHVYVFSLVFRRVTDSVQRFFSSLQFNRRNYRLLGPRWNGKPSLPLLVALFH